MQVTMDQPAISALDLVELLRHPGARRAAVSAGWAQGVEFDVRELATGMAQHGFFVTEDLAWSVGRCHGANLRCNRCGTYGATWVAGERPGWGSLALCPPHERALAQEYQRHQAALDQLRTVNFEQPARTMNRPRRAAPDSASKSARLSPPMIELLTDIATHDEYYITQFSKWDRTAQALVGRKLAIVPKDSYFGGQYPLRITEAGREEAIRRGIIDRQPLKAA